MATLNVTTSAESSGLYEGALLEMETEATAVVTMEIDGLDMIISANASEWPETDPVIYTITITNTTGVDYTTPLTVTTDVFPVSLFTLDPEMVRLNDSETGFTATVEAGVLTVNLEAAVGAEPAVITFQVSKI